jgi:hypothetical protein
MMSRSIKGFRVSWAGPQRVLAEWETTPGVNYEFEVSADWTQIVRTLTVPPNAADGDPTKAPEQLQKEAGKAVEEFLRLEREGK